MNHVEAKHLNVNYTCDQCSKSFRSRNSLKTHVSTNHSVMGGTGGSPGADNSPKLQGNFSAPPNKFKAGYYSEPYM